MNLEQALNDYLSIRRSLGFRLQQQASSLRNFVAFLRAEGASYITTKLALRWATQLAKAHPAAWAWRLGRVRRFAIWYSATEPRTEIPPTGLLPHRRQRKSPHIYSDAEIATQGIVSRLCHSLCRDASLRAALPFGIIRQDQGSRRARGALADQ